MKRYAVEWAVLARDDLGQIISYIAEDSAINALKVAERIERVAQSLVTFPARGRVLPELREQGVTRYLELIVKPWRLVYRIEGAKVYVVSVLDGRRDLEALLFHRFADL